MCLGIDFNQFNLVSPFTLQIINIISYNLKQEFIPSHVIIATEDTQEKCWGSEIIDHMLYFSKKINILKVLVAKLKQCDDSFDLKMLL